VALAAILVGAVALRAIFFVGLVSGDPQDDGIYYANAFRLYTDGPRYLDRFRNLPPDFLANPIDQFDVRPMVTYPIAASFTLFGPGEEAAVAWAFLCSILSVAVVYRLGLVLHGRSVGLIAAALCAFYPLEVINGTRILSDVQVGFFCSLGLLLLVESASRRRLMLAALAGASAACAYLANGRGLIVLMALAGASALLALLGRAAWKTLPAVVAGFAVVFGLEAAVYAISTGDPLLSYRIQSGASFFKYLHEPVSTLRLGAVEVLFTNGQPLELTRGAFLSNLRGTDQFGLFFWMFAAAALASVVRRRNALLLFLAVGLFFYLDFGAIRLDLSWSPPVLRYFMVFKQERFALLITAPCLVLAAWLIAALGRRSRVAAAVVLMVLVATSVAAIARTRATYRAGLSDLRTATAHILQHPDRRYLGDFWAVEHVKIFSRYRATNAQVLDARATPADLSGACLMLGGSRGVELMSDYVASALPAFARQLLETGERLPGWSNELSIPGEVRAYRLRDFRIDCGK
jgi:4-amino-4-deoxy-L-arabinose transferase-like glycosyltransferase